MNLRTLIKKGRVVDPRSLQSYVEHPDGPRAITLDGIVLDAMDRSRILVNIQSVIDDVYAMPTVAGEWSVAALLEEITTTPKAPPVPPYKKMWLEGRVAGETPVALMVERFDVPDGFRVACLVWGTTNTANAVCIGCVGYSVDKEGRVPRDSVVYDRFTHREDYAVTEEIAVLTWNGALVAHSLARMNCRNVVLHAIASPKVSQRHQRDLVPATVWHEIRITNVPQIRTTGRGVLGRDESKMRRFWVRGHYADYRNGVGLFGNPKLRCVFWIPEHQRGNAELGDVIPEYTLA